MLWSFFALLTGAAIFSILWPLAKPPREGSARSAPDVVFYKAKLAEIAREAAEGLLTPQEAELAQTEAARRLLRIAEADGVPNDGEANKSGPIKGTQDKVGALGRLRAQTRLRFVSLVALLLLPALSLGLYARIGHPNMPDEPLAARLNEPAKDMTLAAAVAKIEAHLLANPNDGRGYEVLVPAYLALGRYGDAARAASLAIQDLGPTPKRETAYGEALVYAANGVVTEQARKLFAQALQGEPPPPLHALFFMGLAAAQDNDKRTALRYWQELLGLLPKGGPAYADLTARIASLNSAPKADAAAAIAAMPLKARAAAIQGMINRLAARLAQNGHDIDGWLRLVRAYKVVNETEKARAALTQARRNFSGDPQATARIDALAHELGLDS